MPIDETQLEITRKDIKHIHLYILPPDGYIRVSAPRWCDDGMILDFIKSKSRWIKTHQDKCRRRPRLPDDCQDGGKLTLFGHALPIIAEEGFRKNTAKVLGGVVFLRLRRDAELKTRQALVKELSATVLREKIQEIMPQIESICGLHPQSWKIRDMRTRWGSCNIRTRVITFSLKLAQQPVHCIEYVVLHELAHLKFPRHDSPFKNFVARFMPDWRERQQEL